MESEFILHRSKLAGVKAWQLIQNLVFFMRNQIKDNFIEDNFGDGTGKTPLIVWGFISIHVNLAPTNQVEFIFERSCWHRYNSKVCTQFRINSESAVEKYMLKGLEYFVNTICNKHINDCRGDMSVVKQLKNMAKSNKLYDELIKNKRNDGTWFWVNPNKKFSVTYHDLYLLYIYFKHYKVQRLNTKEQEQLNSWLNSRYDTIASELEFIRRGKLNDTYKRYAKIADKLYIPHYQLDKVLNTTQYHAGPQELIFESRAIKELTKLIDDYDNKNTQRREKILARRERMLKLISAKFTPLLQKRG